MSALKKEVNEIRAQLADLPRKIAEADRAHTAYISAHPRPRLSWWDRILGEPEIDPLEKKLRDSLIDLQSTPVVCERRLRELERAIKESRKLKKRFLDSQLRLATAERRRAEEEVKRIQFAENCATMASQEFDRNLYFIQPKDYRRGNSVDNYVRSVLTKRILAAFDQRCAFCEGNHDLTFDHYGLTKNEGGNFILIASDKCSFKVNLVVLCRGCNSMKGQFSYLAFFDEVKREMILTYQKRLLDSILSDPELVKLLKKWSK